MVLRSRLSVLLPAEVINKHRFICSIIELYLVGMYFDQRFYVLLSVFGEKMLIFWSGSKIFCSRTQLWAKLQRQRLSDYLLL